MNKESEVGKVFNRLTVLEIIEPKEKGREIRWKCACICGSAPKLYFSGNVKRGTSKSCGCLCRETTSKNRRKKPGESGFKKLYGSYRIRSKNKGICFDLTEEQFRKITQSKCSWCGCEPWTVSEREDACTAGGRDHSRYVYNGIDRFNNNEGYSVENSLPCCKRCNYAKHAMEIEEFEAWLNQLVNFNKDRVDAS